MTTCILDEFVLKKLESLTSELNDTLQTQQGKKILNSTSTAIVKGYSTTRSGAVYNKMGGRRSRKKAFKGGAPTKDDLLNGFASAIALASTLAVTGAGCYYGYEFILYWSTFYGLVPKECNPADVLSNLIFKNPFSTTVASAAKGATSYLPSMAQGWFSSAYGRGASALSNTVGRIMPSSIQASTAFDSCPTMASNRSNAINNLQMILVALGGSGLYIFSGNVSDYYSKFQQFIYRILKRVFSSSVKPTPMEPSSVPVTMEVEKDEPLSEEEQIKQIVDELIEELSGKVAPRVVQEELAEMREDEEKIEYREEARERIEKREALKKQQLAALVKAENLTQDVVNEAMTIILNRPIEPIRPTEAMAMSPGQKTGEDILALLKKMSGGKKNNNHNNHTHKKRKHKHNSNCSHYKKRTNRLYGKKGGRKTRRRN